MTIGSPYFIGIHEVDMALRFLGPADCACLEPSGCFENIVLVIKHLAYSILRIINYLCGDHQWHNNHTARTLIERYIAQYRLQQQGTPLHEKICELFDALCLRANEGGSFADGIDASVLRCQEPDQQREVIAHISCEETSAAPEPPAGFNQHSFLENLFTIIYRCASEINDLDHRSDILCEVVRIQASCRTEQALHLANTIHNMDKQAEALAIVYQTMAKTNREEAIASAHQLQNPLCKAQALRKIAKMLVHIDENCAQSLLQEAFTSACSIQDNFVKDEVLSSIAKTQACINPQYALSTANHIQSTFFKGEALYTAAVAIAPLSPEQALITANRITNNFYKNKTLCEIAQVQALSNLEQAFMTAELIQGIDAKDQAYVKIAKALSASNPEQAQAAAGRIQNLQHQVEALCEIAKVQGSTNAPLAHELIEKALFAAAQIPRDNQSSAFCKIVSAQAMVDIEEAFTTVDLIPFSSKKDHAYYSIFKLQAANNPIEAISRANAIRDPLMKIKLLCEIAKTQYSINLQQSEAIFLQALGIAHAASEDIVKQCHLYCTIGQAVVSL